VRAAVAAAAGLFCALPALASAQTADAAPGPRPGYTPQVIRWQEDYSGYKDIAPNAGFPLDLKYIPVGGDSYLTLGGDYRFRVDNYAAPDFGEGRVRDFTSLQHRIFLYGDAHLGPDVRVFVQVGAGLESGRPFIRLGDRDDVDIIQAFADVKFGPEAARWRLRVGRQEVSIGRYVAIRDGVNIPLTFDGVRVDGSAAGWTLLGLAAETTRIKTHDLNDADPHDKLALALVEHATPLKGFKAGLVLSERDNDHALYAIGPGAERRGTIGLRLFGGAGAWDADGQASYQFGRYTPLGRPRLDISAYGAAFEGGRTFAELPTQPRAAIRIDYASGDERAGRLGTFDLPDPNITYLTDAAIIVPRNVHDVQPFVVLRPAKPLTLTLGAELLWRNSLKDSVYSPAFTPVVPPGGRGHYVASQPYLRVDWRVTPLVELQGGYECGIPGEALKTFGGHRDLNFGYAAWTVRF
jgi:hypothetical protein